MQFGKLKSEILAKQFVYLKYSLKDLLVTSSSIKKQKVM